MSLTTLGSEPQPSLAWTFESSNVDYVTNLQPSSTVQPGPAQLQGAAALVTNAPTSNTAVYFTGPYATSSNLMNLGTSSPAKFDYNSSNLFCEFWWYTSNTTTGNLNSPISLGVINTNQTSYRAQVRLGSGFQVNFSTSVSNTTPLSSGTWYHLAFSVDSTNKVLYPFVNGYGGVSASYTGTLSYTSTHTVIVGYSNALSTAYYYDQYIRDLRVVQGGVVPTATFTPGAAPFSYALPSYVTGSGSTVFTLLGQFITYNPSGKFGSALTIQNPKVGAGGISNTYITWTTTTPLSGVSLISGVTISLWVNFSQLSPSGECAVFNFTNGGSGQLGLTLNPTTVYWKIGDGAGNYYIGSSSSLPTVGTWVHYTITASNGTAQLYTNGTLIAGSVGSYPLTATWPLNIAYAGGVQTYGPTSASYDDLRIYQTALTAAQVRSIYTQGGAPASSFRSVPQATLAWDFNGRTAPYIGTAAGTVTGSVPYNLNGKYGQSIIITNSTSSTAQNYISYSTGPIFTVQGTQTIWIKTYTTGTDSQYFLQFGGSSGGISYALSLTSTNQVNIRVQAVGGVITNIITTTTLQIGQWYHIAVVMDGSSHVVYINGVLSAGPNPSNTTGFSYFSPRIGGSTTNSGRVFVNGELDDLRIYNTALSAAQVQSIYAAQGMPSRAVKVKSPIQPGFIYEPYNNYTIIGNPDVKVINSSNPDPRIYVVPEGSLYAQWTADPNLLTKWYNMPFKYYILLGIVFNVTPTNGLRFPVSVPTTTTYNVQILVYGAGGNTDSLWIAMDGEVAVQLSVINTTPTWRTGLASKSLTAGDHTLELYMREPYGIGGIRIIPTGGVDPTLSAFRQNMTGTPLFTQLSPSAVSSAVGAFSLRAVNGTSAKAVQVVAHPVVQWPPIAMTSNTFTATGTYNGVVNGVYTVTASVPNSTIWYISDNNINTYYEQASAFLYDYNTGTYIGSNATTISTVSVSGEWFQIQMPTPVILRSYTLVGRQDNNYWNRRNPTTFWIAGSSDGSTWSNVHQQTGLSPPQGGITLTVPQTSNSLPYSYYRLVVNIIGYSSDARNLVNLASWNLYGDAAAYATTTQDFYADRRGNLLTAPVTGQSLAKWLGGETGYVSTWYDQSGRGNHATQTTAANQPIIQKATKGAGYMCVYSGAQSLTFGAYDLLNGTNYTTCGVVRRTIVPAGSNYYLSGNGGVNALDQKFHSGYITSTQLKLAHYADDKDLTVPVFLTSTTEPVAYNYLMVGAGLSGRLYSYSTGTLYSTTHTYIGYLNHAVGSSFSIGGGFGTFTGEIYELLVFTRSLYDLDGTTSITNIYNNQVSYTGV